MAVLVFCFTWPAAADPMAEDPAIPDTLMIDSVAAFTNGVGQVPVNFVNDEALAGIELTVTIGSPEVQVDSFSFVGGRADYISVKGTFTRSGSYSVYCLPVSGEELIAPGSGLFGTLFLSWNSGIAPQLVPIDSITVLDNDVEYSTTFSDAVANNFKPQFERGYVDIEQGFGCCVGIRGNVDGDPADNVNVADLTWLVAYLFQGGPPADCPTEANVDGSIGVEPNVADLTWIVAFLFQGGPPPAPCE